LELVVIYHVIRSDGSEFEHVSNLPPNYNNNNKVLDPKISGRLWILTSLVRVSRIYYFPPFLSIYFPFKKKKIK